MQKYFEFFHDSGQKCSPTFWFSDFFFTSKSLFQLFNLVSSLSVGVHLGVCLSLYALLKQFPIRIDYTSIVRDQKLCQEKVVIAVAP